MRKKLALKLGVRPIEFWQIMMKLYKIWDETLRIFIFLIKRTGDSNWNTTLKIISSHYVFFIQTSYAGLYAMSHNPTDPVTYANFHLAKAM